MQFDAQRRRDERRFELEKMRREIEAYDDAVQREARKGKGRRYQAVKQAKTRREVDEMLANKAARKSNPLPKRSPGVAAPKEMNRAVMKARGGTFKGTF